VKTIELAEYDLHIGNDIPLTFIGGPCVLEDNGSYVEVAKELSDICRELSIRYIFKASYDKANRSSIASYRGPGLRLGLEMLGEVKAQTGVPILTDCHSVAEIEEVAASGIVDVIQVPAFLSRQTDLIVAAARSGRVVNVKKGQFLAPQDVANIVEKFNRSGGSDLIITERGASFGYHNLVVDMRSFAIIKEMDVPVCFDATHSVQLPGGLGTASGGQREFVLPLSRSAVAQGIAALFWEVHPRPEEALSDGPNMLPLSDARAALSEIKALDDFVKASAGETARCRGTAIPDRRRSSPARCEGGRRRWR